MHRLYQWLSQRASLLRSGSPRKGTTRTARTEVTIERQEMFLVLRGASANLNYCPFCGGKLADAQAEKARLSLLETVDQGASVDGPALNESVGQGVKPGNGPFLR